MICIQGLTKRFGNLVAVNDLHLDVGAGELFGFLGPNGAGKTTTVRMLVGLQRPTAGTAQVAGYDILATPLQVKASSAYMSEHPFLYEKLTGYQYLRFIQGLYGINSAAASRQLDRLLQLFELQGVINDLIESYSHGMRQKLVLSCALLLESKVLFLDEPLQGLDPRSARAVKDILKWLCARGTTVFMCTHVLEIAEHICDRVAIINGGQLVAVGSLDDIRQQTGAGESSLEDLFLELTGGPIYSDLARYLQED